MALSFKTFGATFLVPGNMILRQIADKEGTLIQNTNLKVEFCYQDKEKGLMTQQK